MKFLYLNKSQGYILATLLCLVTLGSCYFFIYLPANEKKVEEQRFRTLQNIDRNIHDKIDNSELLLKNLLNNYSPATKDYLEEYIRNYPADKFSLSVIHKAALSASQIEDTLRDPVNIVVNNATRLISITLSKADTSKTSLLQGSLKYSFQQFITSLLPDAVFDEYIVFSKGDIVYESFPSGISRVKEDSLLNTSNGINGSYVKDISAGGKDYKLFLQTVTFDSSHKWVMGGLLSKARYHRERTELPTNLILLMVTIVVGIIVIFPWIKLYQMGSKDRLTITDGTSSIVVAMLLMSLLFFCFFKYNGYVRNSNISSSKLVLDSTISNAFYSETAKHYHILKQYDSIQNADHLTSIVNLLKPAIAIDRSVVNAQGNSGNILLPAGTKQFLNHYKDTADIKQVFWLDSTGTEVYNWTTDSRNAPKNNFSARSYFKSIVEERPFYLYGDTAVKYSLDQVVSRTSGSFTSIISKPSVCGSSKVAAMSFTMRSVQDVVMPTGYSFAIIDTRGKVLYHSLKSRNLNENIKTEFSDSTGIASCIETHTAAEFNTLYYSKNYYVRITPLNNLPYFILIFSDNQFKETRDVEVYTFTFSMLLLFFLYMVVQLSITFLVSSRRSFFKKQLFDTSWIGPKVSFHREYTISAIINVAMIIVLIICFTRTTFFQYLFLLLFSVTLISLFLNTLFARRYLKEGKTVPWRYKRIAVYWLWSMLIIVNVAAIILLDWPNFWPVLLIECLITVAGFVFMKYANPLVFKINNAASPKLNYIRSFSLMTITCLIISSGLPIAFFYKTSYNFEQNLGTRYRQTDYANRLIQQPTAHVYHDSTWIWSIPTVVEKENIRFAEKPSYEKEVTDKVLAAFHLPVGDRLGKANKQYKTYATDSSIIYQPLVSAKDSFVYAYRQTANAEKYLRITSSNSNYIIPAPYKNPVAFLYWVLLAAGLVMFYFVINNIVKKLFCLNLPDLAIWQQMDDKILVDNELNKLLLVIGLPGAGKFKYITDKIEDGEIKWNDQPVIYKPGNAEGSEVFVAELINIPTAGEAKKDEQWKVLMAEVVKPKYKIVIVNHFEYNMHCATANAAKLDLMEQLMVNSACKIIILSTLHPLSFIDSLNETVAKSEEAVKSVQDLDRWHVLLGHFRISIMPITRGQYNYDPSWHQLLCSETEYTHYMQQMRGVTLSIATGIQEDEVVEKADQLAYKLQVSAQYFYMYIWQSLTKEEKFLLYDLAEDNLVNSYDDYNLTMLIAKGVIIHSNGLLRLFNRGFRNFILTAIGNAEVLKIKERIRESGNWSNLKTPLIIIILAILSFLLISQQEAYSKLLTYVAALTAGVPAILKIFSLFDKSASKTNA